MSSGPIQFLDNTASEVFSGPAYWNRDAGSLLYVWSNANYLNAYSFNGSTFDPKAVSQSTFTAPENPGGDVLALSANGGQSGTGIVWSSMTVKDDADVNIVHGVLRAFDAENLTNELWNSCMPDAAGSCTDLADDIGNWPKFNPPTVANGHVYLASFPDDGIGSTAVSVFGLLPVSPGHVSRNSPR